MVNFVSKNGIGVRPRFVKSTIPVLTALSSIGLISIFSILEIESSRNAALLVSRRACFDCIKISERRAWQAQTVPMHDLNAPLGLYFTIFDHDVSGINKLSQNLNTASEFQMVGDSDKDKPINYLQKGAYGITASEPAGITRSIKSGIDFSRKPAMTRDELLQSLQAMLTYRKRRGHQSPTHSTAFSWQGKKQSLDSLPDQASDAKGTKTSPCGFGRFAHIPCPKASEPTQGELKAELSHLERFVSAFVSESTQEAQAERSEIEKLKALRAAAPEEQGVCNRVLRCISTCPALPSSAPHIRMVASSVSVVRELRAPAPLLQWSGAS
jgi:hypothetical protein